MLNRDLHHNPREPTQQTPDGAVSVLFLIQPSKSVITCTAQASPGSGSGATPRTFAVCSKPPFVSPAKVERDEICNLPGTV